MLCKSMVNNNNAGCMLWKQRIMGPQTKQNVWMSFFNVCRPPPRQIYKILENSLSIKAVTIPNFTMQLHVAKRIHENDIILLSILKCLTLVHHLFPLILERVPVATHCVTELQSSARWKSVFPRWKTFNLHPSAFAEKNMDAQSILMFVWQVCEHHDNYCSWFNKLGLLKKRSGSRLLLHAHKHFYQATTKLLL